MDHHTQAIVKEAVEQAILETLRHCDQQRQRELKALHALLEKLIMTNAELVTALNGLTTQVGTVTAGITALVAQLGQVPAEVVTAVGNLTTAVNAAQAALPAAPAPAPAPAA